MHRYWCAVMQIRIAQKLQIVARIKIWTPERYKPWDLFREGDAKEDFFNDPLLCSEQHMILY